MSRKKIIIGVIIDTAFKIPPNTGVTYRLYYLSRELSKLGLKVKLFLCNRNIKSDNNLNLLFEKSEIEYHIIPEYIFYDIKKLFSIILKNKPDILQFEDCQTLIRCRRIWSELNIPICLEMHDVEAILKKYLGFSHKEIEEAERITKDACLVSDQVVCMTPLDLKQLVENKLVDKKKINISPNPIDTNEFMFCGPNLKSFNIIFVGNMFYWPNYNAVKLIINEVFPRLRHIKKLKFYFVGMFPKRLKNINKSNQILFTGSVDNLNKYLRKSSIALCPVKEGSGMKVKILNYCSAGLPVITTKIGASGYENIKSLIVEDDIEKYADIINTLYFKKNNLLRIGKMNRSYVKKYFDIKKIATKMINVYNKLLKNYKHKYGFDVNLENINDLLWLKEKRLSIVKNKNYYIIQNGKVIFKEKSS